MDSLVTTLYCECLHDGLVSSIFHHSFASVFFPSLWGQSQCFFLTPKWVQPVAGRQWIRHARCVRRYGVWSMTGLAAVCTLSAASQCKEARGRKLNRGRKVWDYIVWDYVNRRWSIIKLLHPCLFLFFLRVSFCVPPDLKLGVRLRIVTD